MCLKSVVRKGLGKESGTSRLALADCLEKKPSSKWSEALPFSLPFAGSLLTAETVSLSGYCKRASRAEGKVVQAQTAWLRERKQLCASTHSRRALPRDWPALGSSLVCYCTTYWVLQGSNQLHVQRSSLNSVTFLPSVFLALSDTQLRRALSLPDLCILNATLEIWSLLEKKKRAPRPMLLCSSASCLKTQSTGKLFLTAHHNHPVSSRSLFAAAVVSSVTVPLSSFANLLTLSTD